VITDGKQQIMTLDFRPCRRKIAPTIFWAGPCFKRDLQKQFPSLTAALARTFAGLQLPANSASNIAESDSHRLQTNAITCNNYLSLYIHLQLLHLWNYTPKSSMPTVTMMAWSSTIHYILLF